VFRATSWVRRVVDCVGPDALSSLETSTRFVTLAAGWG
jgi:hypothetical protein